MKKLLTYGLCFLMALTCLTGCGGTDQADLRVAVGGDTADLDPAIVDDSITANILAQVYQGLYVLDTDGNVIPNLATDMPESFRLRICLETCSSNSRILHTIYLAIYRRYFSHGS